MLPRGLTIYFYNKFPCYMITDTCHLTSNCCVTLYIYCPVWWETWWFVPPRKFMSPKGEARGWHEFSGWDKSSCLSTNWAINCLLYRKLKHMLYSAERCAVRHDRETQHLEGDTTICLPPRDFPIPIILFLYSSYQFFFFRYGVNSY